MRWRFILKVFVIATTAALMVRLFFLEDYRISSSSMYPTLFPGDLVFVSKLAYNVRIPFSSYEVVKIRRPLPGEVVAFTLPEHGIETFVKRVVAVAGDRVEVRGGKILVNGVEAKYQPVKSDGEPSSDKLFQEEMGKDLKHEVNLAPGSSQDYGPVDIPKDHFFVLGDNRNDSVDSRTWGPVPYSCLKGKVSIVWLSWDPVKASLRSARAGTVVN